MKNYKTGVKPQPRNTHACVRVRVVCVTSKKLEAALLADSGMWRRVGDTNLFVHLVDVIAAQLQQMS